MANPLDIQLSPSELPQPQCYANEQARLAAYVAAIIVNSASGAQWVTSQDAPADKTKYWLRTDSSGLPIGAYVWETADGAWVPWQQELAFGTGAGSLNAFTVTNTPPFGNGALFLVGRIISFISTQNVTGASTVTVDGGPSHAIKKAGVADLQNGDIVVGQTVVIQWDGTNWQMLNPIKPSPASTVQIYDSGLQAVPTGDNSIVGPFTHPFAGTPQEIEWFLECIVAAPVSAADGTTLLQYTTGDRLLCESICNVSETSVYIPQIVNATQVQLGPYPWVTEKVCVIRKSSGGTGGDGAAGFSWSITPTEWKFRCLATYTPP